MTNTYVGSLPELVRDLAFRIYPWETTETDITRTPCELGLTCNYRAGVALIFPWLW